ncbi:MAG: 5-methylthioadenosine phosphorylase [Actinomycetota bacterium]|nr:5-methylthioadenosine phosphorylase [Actinomycetota bacterium]
MSPVSAEVGVFGGSGFYSFLDDVVEVSVHTPYGPPSAPVAVGTVDGRRVAFLPRHGVHHELPPHRVDFRANVWAMGSLGVRRLLGPCAVGSLQPDIHPGDFVVCDQLVDRTYGRSADTFFDGGVVGHVSFADPYCPELRPLAVSAARSSGITVHEGGTVVVVRGPRFSTRAESSSYRREGWHVINMTQYPEAYLARELGICYSGIGLVTDYDTGVSGSDGEAVTMADVFAVLRANVDRTRALLARLIPLIPSTPSCSCASALDQGPLGR